MHHYTKDMYGGAYDREDFPEQQRKILQDWADFCYSLNFPKNLHSNTGTGDYFPKKVISS